MIKQTYGITNIFVLPTKEKERRTKERKQESTHRYNVVYVQPAGVKAHTREAVGQFTML